MTGGPGASDPRPPCGAGETFLDAAGGLIFGLLLAWWAELLLAAAVCWWGGVVLMAITSIDVLRQNLASAHDKIAARPLDWLLFNADEKAALQAVQSVVDTNDSVAQTILQVAQHYSGEFASMSKSDFVAKFVAAGATQGQAQAFADHLDVQHGKKGAIDWAALFAKLQAAIPTIVSLLSLLFPAA